MRLIGGLGNPGREYELNRHSVGFMVADALAYAHGLTDLRPKYSGLVSRGTIGDEEVTLLKPQTFMNLSGDSVQPAASWLKLAPEDMIIVHDELDLPWKTIRLKTGGGHAGHNGLRSIIQRLGTADFVRVRVGIGRPPAGFRGEIADWVLSNFDGSERAELDDVVAASRDAVVDVVRIGMKAAIAALEKRTSGWARKK